MNTKSLKLVMGIVVCSAMAVAAQPSKNTYSVGFSGNYYSSVQSNNRNTDNHSKYTNGNFQLYANYYFAKHLFAGLNYGYTISNNNSYSNNNPNYNGQLHYEGRQKQATQYYGVGVGYYTMLSPKVLFSLMLQYNYGSIQYKSNYINYDKNTVVEYTSSQESNETGNGKSHSINVLPSLQYVVNKHLSVGLSLANLSYTNSKINRDINSKSYNQYSQNGVITSIEKEDNQNNVYYNNELRGSVSLSNLLVGVNYFFGNKIVESK